MRERRIQRIQELIKERVAEVVDQDLADPRRGLITITRVKVDREMQHCLVFWSVLGDEKVRRLNEQMLDHAASYVQKEVAQVLHTRTVPRVKFVFDESVEGVQRIDALLADLRREREALDGSDPDEDTPSDPDEPVGE